MACEILIRLYLLIFFTDVVGLDPKLAGTAAAVAILWDAITDPLMGVVSDRTESRWGRRRPYILGGSILLAGAMITLFSPMDIETQSGKFWFLLLAYMFVNTATTVIAIPHAALGTEISSDRRQITAIYAWKLVAGNLGAIFGTVVPGILLSKISTRGDDVAARAAAHQSASYLVAILVIITAAISVVATRAPRGTTSEATHVENVATKTSYPVELMAVAKNRPFLILFTAYLIATIGVNINSSLAFYYYKYRLELTEADTQKIIAFFMIVFTAGLIAWIGLARRYGKKIPLVAGTTGLGLMTAIGYPLFAPGSFQGPLLAAVLGGFFVGSILMLDAWLVDVIDYDSVRTRQQRSGIYFGVWKMGAKSARACAVAISGWTLSWINFQPNAEQTPDVAWKLALAFGPGVAIFFLCGGLIALAVPLNEGHTIKIQRIMARRSRQNTGINESGR